MPDREKMKVEFIESYWTGGELGSDYKWSDNHGELVRCRNCVFFRADNIPEKDFGFCEIHYETHSDEDYCSEAEKKG